MAAGRRGRSGHHVGKDATSRKRDLLDALADVPRNDNRIAGSVDTGDDADVSAIRTPRHDRDGADLRPGHMPAIGRKRTCQIRIVDAVSGPAEHEVHEMAAPQGAAPGGIGADPSARFGNEARRATRAARRNGWLERSDARRLRPHDGTARGRVGRPHVKRGKFAVAERRHALRIRIARRWARVRRRRQRRHAETARNNERCGRQPAPRSH